MLQTTQAAYNTHAAHLILLKVFGLSSFQAAATKDWNDLQKTLKLENSVSL